MSLLSRRVIQTELVAMQCDAATVEHHGRPIARIADHRMTGMRELKANLVLATRNKVDL